MNRGFKVLCHVKIIITGIGGTIPVKISQIVCESSVRTIRVSIPKGRRAAIAENADIFGSPGSNDLNPQAGYVKSVGVTHENRRASLGTCHEVEIFCCYRDRRIERGAGTAGARGRSCPNN